MLTKRSILSLVLLIVFILITGCIPRKAENLSSQDIARQKLQKQIEHDYRNPDLHYQLGKLYQSSGLWAQAEQEFRVAINYNLVHKPSQAALVKTLFDSGQSSEAKTTAKVFMDAASVSDTAALELGIALQNEGLDDYALICYQNSLALAPTSYKANKQLGFFYLKKGDKEKAKQYLIASFNSNRFQPDVAEELGKLGVAIESQPAPKPKPTIQPNSQ